MTIFFSSAVQLLANTHVLACVLVVQEAKVSCERNADSLISGHERWLVWGRDLDIRRFHVPDIAGVLSDGPVAGELSRGGDVPDHHPGPFSGVLTGSISDTDC